MTQSAWTVEGFDRGKAIRLLAGNPDEVRAGMATIDSAAARGDPDALERQAVLEAMGCCRKQDWRRALDCLEAAAERGSRAAQDQLIVLAGARETAADLNWHEVRSRISIERLLSSPAKSALSQSPRLRVMEVFATAQECEWLIDSTRARLRPATVVNPTGSQNVQAVRTNSAVEFQVADMDLVVEVIRARISAAVNLPLPLFEPGQVLRYAPGEEFKPHCDYFDPQLPGHADELRRFGQRIATVLIYLNDEYAGGETAFPRAGLTFRGRTGDALFMANVDRSGRPDPSTLHAGTPPGSGEKWVYSQWIRDKVPGLDSGGEAIR